MSVNKSEVHMSLVTRIHELRKQRLDLQRKADLLDQEEKTLMEELIFQMRAASIDSIEDDGATVELKSSVEPVVQSWPELLDYIKRTGHIDLFQKRITPSAVKLRWSDDQIIPGISAETKYTIKFI
jgi:hypothetical protein